MNNGFKLGEVRLPCDEDFNFFKKLCTDEEGWQLDYAKSDVCVWTKPSQYSSFLMLRSRCDIPDINAEVVYDVLHDPDFRKKWDKCMFDSYDICSVGSNSDISYYGLSALPPFQNRDFVMQRVWLQTKEYSAIIGHSVFHKGCPPKKGVIRALSYISGYLVQSTGPNSCVLYCISQCDPRGSLPVWIVNKVTQIVAPATLRRIIKSTYEYPVWKQSHNPSHKPWLYPDQMTLPNIVWSDVQENCDFDVSKMHLDEQTKEDDFNVD